MQFGILSRACVGAIAVATALSWCVGCNLAAAKPGGFSVYMITESHGCPTDYDSGRIVASALGNHRFRINDSDILDRAGLVRELENILKYRAVKAIWVRAEADTWYSDFIEMVDNVYRSGDLVAIYTDKVSELERQGGCVAIWGAIRNRQPNRLPGSILPDGLK